MSASTQNLRKRLVHQLDTPFSTASWPEISPGDQDTILELLCSLLSPIGHHRRTHVQPSKGKRAGKRKRKDVKEAETGTVDKPRPPPPEVASSIDVGFNAISRSLEAQSSPAATDDGSRRSYSMVFVARGNQSPVFNSHFPQMIGAASRDMAPEAKTRLVGFSRPCSDRLSNCLGIARVSSIAICCDAPGASALLSVVQGVVAPIEAPWLNQPDKPAYHETSIKTSEATIGAKKSK